MLQKAQWIAAYVLWTTASVLSYAVTDGMLLYFPMEEGQGNVVKDASGNGRDGSIVGSAKWVDAKYAKGIQVGASDEINVKDDGTLDGMTELTAEMWVNMEAQQATGLIQKGANWPGMSYLIQPWSDGQIYFGINDTSSRAITKAGDFPLSKWFHLAAVYDGKQLRLYINGEKKAEAPPPVGVKAVPDTQTPLQIGSRFAGAMDEFILYKRALTDAEIKSDMAGKVLPVRPLGKLATVWGRVKASNR